MQKAIKTSLAPQAIGPYSQAVQIPANGMMFVSGQLGLDPKTGDLVQGDISAQTKQVLQNMSAILQAAGASLAQVVKTTVFLQNIDDFSAMNKVYAEFFPTLPPARSTIEVARLPKGALVEIEAIAVLS